MRDMNKYEKGIREKVFERAGLTPGEWVYLVGVLNNAADDWPAQEMERLEIRNAALVEALEASRCPVDMRSLVKDCQQCGCCNGILIRAVLGHHRLEKQMLLIEIILVAEITLASAAAILALWGLTQDHCDDYQG